MIEHTIPINLVIQRWQLLVINYIQHQKLYKDKTHVYSRSNFYVIAQWLRCAGNHDKQQQAQQVSNFSGS